MLPQTSKCVSAVSFLLVTVTFAQFPGLRHGPRRQRFPMRNRYNSVPQLLFPSVTAEEGEGAGNETDWSAFVPATPAPEEIDCHVEVEVVHRIGGRCVRLGGVRQMSVCQSGMYLDVHNTECQMRMHREAIIQAALNEMQRVAAADENLDTEDGETVEAGGHTDGSQAGEAAETVGEYRGADMSLSDEEHALGDLVGNTGGERQAVSGQTEQPVENEQDELPQSSEPGDNITVETPQADSA
ncbi:uncharacterized protein LOC128242606 [Mya arenaria]|nr:uncharacterized protein LOC128242606 [Mya arenaria]